MPAVQIHNKKDAEEYLREAVNLALGFGCQAEEISRIVEGTVRRVWVVEEKVGGERLHVFRGGRKEAEEVYASLCGKGRYVSLFSAS